MRPDNDCENVHCERHAGHPGDCIQGGRVLVTKPNPVPPRCTGCERTDGKHDDRCQGCYPDEQCPESVRLTGGPMPCWYDVDRKCIRCEGAQRAASVAQPKPPTWQAINRSDCERCCMTGVRVNEAGLCAVCHTHDHLAPEICDTDRDTTTNLADGLPADGQRGECDHGIGLSVECFACPPHGRTLVTGHLVRTRMHSLGAPAMRVLLAYYSWMKSDADDDAFDELRGAMQELENRAGIKLDQETGIA